MSFWRDRRVLVTGHTGFKGAWLCLWLSHLGAEVTGYALEPAGSPNFFTELGLARRMRSHIGDVRDLSCFQDVAGESKPEVIFHLAAQALVGYGYENPRETFATNIMGTVNTLEIARASTDLRAVVVVTSDKCYKNDGRLTSYSEGDALGGEDPYASSKACAELVSEAYETSFFRFGDCAIATARAGNVIGGGDWARDRLVPDIVRSIFKGETLTLRNPNATRPWQHVLEPLQGYIELAQRLTQFGHEYRGAWNFGPRVEESIKVADLASAMFAALGRAPRWDTNSSSSYAEQLSLSIDATKAQEKLGWRSRLTSVDAARWTADWYASWHRGESIDQLSLSEIERYMGMVHAD